MARITPTVNSTRSDSVQGDRRVKVVNLTIAGTYNSASASAGGALLTPAQVGLTAIESVKTLPCFTADSIEEFPLSVGSSTSTTAGWVFALADKADCLETADTTAVTGVTFDAEVTGY